jgi:hypothetical protein
MCIIVLEVKTLASDILTKWMDIFREGQAGKCLTILNNIILKYFTQMAKFYFYPPDITD